MAVTGAGATQSGAAAAAGGGGHSAGPGDGSHVGKRMSLSETEFRSGVAALLGGGVGAFHGGALPVRVGVGAGTVTIGYEPLPAVRLGGLLELPQAAVSLTFEGVDAGARAEFERRFWIVFQRGGG